jgi:folate-binding protein YgfZ
MLSLNSWEYMDHRNDQQPSPGASAGTDDTAPAVPSVGALNTAQLAAGFVATIDSLGLIAVTGEDAASFLHNQLTNDVEHLGVEDARLAAYCSPKGRMQASFLMWRSTDTIYLQLARELQAALQKRLSMFVLRAKAKLADASPEFITIGLGGAAAGEALRELAGALPGAPYRKLDTAIGSVIELTPAFGAPRYLLLLTPAMAGTVLPALHGKLAVGGDQAWHLAAIHAGVPLITQKTQEQFVPQMVNFELLGGVNFKKGCYPGQEIVARSQYLGKLKRRTALATTAAGAQAGDEVFAESDPGQPCGMIVNAADNGDGGADVLVELKLAVLDGTAVHLGAPGGAALRFLPMPYPLDAIDV